MREVLKTLLSEAGLLFNITGITILVYNIINIFYIAKHKKLNFLNLLASILTLLIIVMTFKSNLILSDVPEIGSIVNSYLLLLSLIVNIINLIISVYFCIKNKS